MLNVRLAHTFHTSLNLFETCVTMNDMLISYEWTMAGMGDGPDSNKRLAWGVRDIRF